MKYFFMSISIILAVVNAGLLRKYAKGDKDKYNVFLFNGGVSIVWIAVLLGLFLYSDTTIDPTAVIYGAFYGITLFAFLLFKMQAMATGPISLGTLIGSSAFVVATAFGVIYAHEEINLFQIIGIILLLISIVLCVKPQKAKEKLSTRWYIYCLGFFLAGGIVGIIYKLFGASESSNNVEIMVLTAALVSTLLFTAFGVIGTKKRGERIIPSKRCLAYIILCGLASCIYIRINISLSAIIPSIIFFPVSNGSMVILSTVVGRIIFKERLNTTQIVGIALGCIAVIITGCEAYLFGLINA